MDKKVLVVCKYYVCRYNDPLVLSYCRLLFETGFLSKNEKEKSSRLLSLLSMCTPFITLQSSDRFWRNFVIRHAHWMSPQNLTLQMPTITNNDKRTYEMGASSTPKLCCFVCLFVCLLACLFVCIVAVVVYHLWCTGVLISPWPDLLHDVFCLIVRIFRSMPVFYIYIYIYRVLIFLQLWL